MSNADFQLSLFGDTALDGDAKPDSEFTPQGLGTLFRELDVIDAYVDEKIGASASFGKIVLRGGWVIPEQFDLWRL